MLYSIETIKEHLAVVEDFIKSNGYSYNTSRVFGNDLVITIEGDEFPYLCLNDTIIKEL